MRLGRDDAPDGVKSVPSGLSWPLAAVMPVTLRSCSVPGQAGWPKPSAQFDPAWPAKFRRHSRPATSEKGHSRRLGHVGDMSGLPQAPDISGPGLHFAFVPLADMTTPLRPRYCPSGTIGIGDLPSWPIRRSRTRDRIHPFDQTWAIYVQCAL